MGESKMYASNRDLAGFFEQENVNPYAAFKLDQRTEGLFCFLMARVALLVGAINCGHPALLGLLAELEQYMESEESGFKWTEQWASENRNPFDHTKQFIGRLVQYLVGEFGFEKSGEGDLAYGPSVELSPKYFRNASYYQRSSASETSEIAQPAAAGK